MLKVFRDNLKYLSWVLWLVIAVFILFVFVDFGGTVPGSAAAPNTAAVTVGRQKITYGEFQRAYEQFEAFYRDAMGDQFSPEMARQLGLPQQVLNRLIGDRILAAEGRRMGLEVTDRELRDEILRQFGGSVSEEEYRRVLRLNGLTTEGFEAGLRRDLLANKARDVLAANLYVSEAEVERAYRDRVERAKIRYLRLPASEVSAEVTLEPGALETYFAEHREDYRIPERRSVTYLEIDRQEIQNGLEIGAAEVEAYYQDNPDEFRVEEQVQARHILVQVDPTAAGPEQAGKDRARARIEEARRRIEAGEPFADVAAEVSEDPGSKERGGDLGTFGRGAMVPPFENAAFAAEPNTLVGPVETDFGFHLIEVLDKKPGGVQPLAEVEPLIRQRLATTRAAALAESKARALADRIERQGLEPEAWEQLAVEEAGVSVETTPPFTRDEYVEGIGSATEFSSRAFELAPGEASEPLAIGSGWAVLAVTAVEEPRYPELDEVRVEVEAAALEAKQLELALARLQEAAARLAGGETFDQVAGDLGLQPVDSPLFGREDSLGALGRNPEIAAAALELEVGETGGPLAVDDGAVLFEVVERQHFDPELFADDKDSERATLRDRRFGELLDSLIAERRRELGVSFDPQLVANFDLADAASS